MSVIKYIGRTTDFKGKPLWEIVGNLKNFGVGRVVVRSMFERYPEPSYMRIVKVEALPNQEIRKVKVTMEKTFRGRTYPKLVVIDSVSYKADYRLLSKHEEESYCRTVERSERIIATETDMPPLLREFIQRETGKINPKIPVKMKPGHNNIYRLAKKGETPNIEIPMGLGKPASPRLYQNCDI
ncbi:uncharacterized protein LOC131691439 [Topomyia yanbarensis]|uniref:uncharacterized protein LOC131691439 n=1 Tax=Topomyia yanbarensis TaxID=2498891 RepID=UPI00273B03E3|nr:uncharacterized protein LOC131691439 [Topomyia yanbarensis]